MIKSIFFGALIWLCIPCVHAQRKIVDSLLQLLPSAKDDTSRIIIMGSLVEPYKNVNLDSGVYYAQQALLLSRKINDPYVAYTVDNYGYALFNAGIYPDAIEAHLNALQQFQRNAKVIADYYNDDLMRGRFFVEAGKTYEQLNILDTALHYHKQKQKAKTKIEHAYTELKSTQAQLIQSEKMASLGELTAGIAHEIQNPLNFVNNFADVNTELIAEMKEEIDKGNIEEVKSIANDIEDNEQKIIHHGKRADAIVKGMLQHSRISTGQKEPTDINALADEYLRLSYHGMRAKDKNFNAPTKTEFDESIGKIKAVPQDIGRVLLNLFNNAFYAVTEKKKQITEGYEPTVSVYTKKVNGKVEIHVRDNGVGIPQKVVDKIFQPFFTTKPTGQGTGLGLSLSYDIIKAHGGEIKVETKEGEESEFIIQLPIV